MVRLRLGRFAWELYYTQTRAVVPRDEMRRRVGGILGHLGYATGMMEYLMTDMFWMRIWACIGCFGIVGFQMVQPKIQWPSVVWNSVYVGINLFQIYLLKKPPSVLEGEEADLWEALRLHLTQNQLTALLNLGEFRPFEANSKLFEQSQRSPEDEVYVLTAGTCDLRVDGISVQRLGPGSIIGDVDMLQGNADATSTATVVAVGDDVRCFCLSCAELADRLDRDAKLKGSVYAVFAESVLTKVLALNAKSDILEYGAVLEVVGNLGASSGLNAAMENFRHQRGISLEEHERVSAEVVRHAAERRVVQGTLLDRAERRPKLERRSAHTVY